MNLSLRTVTIVSTLIALALGAITLTCLWHPNALEAAMRMCLPQITLATVVVAGIIDGINPCAFTMLLLFITALTSTLQVDEHDVVRLRARMVGLGVGLLASMDLSTR